MKKLFALVLALLMLCGSAFAEIDWASMTDDEIKAAIETAQAELDARKPADAEDGPILIEDGLVLVDFEGIKITVEGTPRLYNMNEFLEIKVIVENNSSHDIYIDNENCVVNGWDSLGIGIYQVDAGHKTKDELCVSVEDAELSKMADIETFTMQITIQDSDTYETIYDSGVVEYTFQ